MSDYDYVIVGAGSAGCVLADRLSAEGAEVLLVEAGGRDRSPKIKIPAAFAQQFQTKLDWDYASGPEPGCDDRSLFVPRGKALGGSSSMNAMLYVRGHRDDYDGWRDERLLGLGLGRRPALLPALRAPRGRRRPDPRDRRPAQRRPSPQPPQAHRPDGRRRSRPRLPLDPDYNDGSPDGVCLVRGDAEERTALERRRRLPEARRGEGPNLTIATATTAIGLELKRRSGDRGPACRPRPLRRGAGAPRGDPGGRRDRLPAAPDAVGDRRPRLAVARPTSRRASSSRASAPTSRTIPTSSASGSRRSAIPCSTARSRRPPPSSCSGGAGRSPRASARRSSSPAPTAATGRPTCSSTSPPRSSPRTASRSTTGTPTRWARCWWRRRRAATCACAAPIRPRSRCWWAIT